MASTLNRSFLLSALLLVGLSTGCSPAGRAVEPPLTQPASSRVGSPSATAAPNSTDLTALVASGREVYRQQYCGLCHRLDAVETGGLFGPTHNGMGATADDRIRDPGYTGSSTTAEGYIRESILDPDVYIVSGYAGSRFRMPAYAHLSEMDVDALVQMLLEEK